MSHVPKTGLLLSCLWGWHIVNDPSDVREAIWCLCHVGMEHIGYGTANSNIDEGFHIWKYDIQWYYIWKSTKT